MKRIFLSSIIIYFLCQWRLSNSQNKSDSDTTDFRKNFQEEILLENSQSEEELQLLDFLDALKRDPYDLNKITIEQLESIPFLSSILAKKIIEYRDGNKSFSSKKNLLKVDGITPDLYEKIKIYVIVKKSTSDFLIDETGRKTAVRNLIDKRIFRTKSRSGFSQELQQKMGYLSSKYEGKRTKFYTKINSIYYNPKFTLDANLTIEKDPGEKNYADFVSGYLQVNDFNFIKSIVCGDYTLTFGQGLALWNSQSFSKGTEVISTVKKRSKGIDGFSSTSESGFFRGGAAKINIKDFDISIFYSDNYYDATVDSVINEVSGFYFDGYHRTSSELRRKNSVKEKLAGGRLSYSNADMRAGSTFWTNKFSKPVYGDTSKQLYGFAGESTGMLGFDYEIVFKNMSLFGEFAGSKSNTIASLNSLQLTFYKFADLIFSYRNYPAEFTALHSSGFGERNRESYNERGFYAGISLKPFKGVVINSYFDQYKFPYRTYFNPVASEGSDLLFNCEWRAAKGFAINLKFKNENKEEMRVFENLYGRISNLIDNRNQINVRAGFIYQINDRFRLRSRFEYVNVDYKNSSGDSKGMMFFSDVRVIPVTGLVLDARFIFFDTDDYDSRIYEYESEIKGAMSNLALYGNGRRWYLLLKYKPFIFFEVSAKYSETVLDGVKSIGSGNDEIPGELNNKLNLGLEIGF